MTPKKPLEKLGRVQRAFYNAVQDYGDFIPYGFGCGWVWGSKSASIRIAESLVKLGWLKKVPGYGRYKDCFRYTLNLSPM